MRGVLVGVDESQGARLALRWAAGCARALQQELVALQAWSYPATALFPWGQGSLPSAEEVNERVRAEVAEIVAAELGEDPAVEMQTDALRGPAATALMQRVASADPWLVAVGSRGLGGFAGLLLGSVSRQVLDYSPCPVVVVPQEAAPERVERTMARILVGVDGSAGARHALDWAIQLAQHTGSEIIVIHAFEPTQMELAPPIADERRSEAEAQFHGQWCTPAAETGVAHRCITVDGDPRDELPKLAREHDVDLLVAGSLGRGAFATVLGSVANHLVSRAELPVAVVPRHRDRTGS